MLRFAFTELTESELRASRPRSGGFLGRRAAAAASFTPGLGMAALRDQEFSRKLAAAAGWLGMALPDRIRRDAAGTPPLSDS